MAKISFDSNGQVVLEPDDQPEVDWSNLIGPSGVPRITVQPNRPPGGFDVPFADDTPMPLPEPTADQLSQAILSQEADTGQPSPLREKAEQRQPVYQDVVAERARRRLDALSQRREAMPEPAPMPGADTMFEPQKQFLRGLMDTIGTLPYEVPSNALKIAGTGYNPGSVNPFQNKGIDAATDWLDEQSGKQKQFSAAVSGAKGANLNPLERGMNILGGFAGPGGPAMKAFTGGATAIELAREYGPEVLDTIMPPAQAQEAKKTYNELQKAASEAWKNRPDKSIKGQDEYNKFLTDFLSKAGYVSNPKGRPANKAPSGVSQQLEQLRQGQDQGVPIAAPQVPQRTAPSTPMPAPFIMQSPRVEQAQIPVESIGGLTTISEGEMKILGGVAAASIGMAFAPKVFKMMKLGRVPMLLPQRWQPAGLNNPRFVREAAPGTIDISRPGDLARTYDDANAGIMRIMDRAGLSPSISERLAMTMRIQTRATANALSDSAINVGRMETPMFTFQTPVPMGQLARRETPEAQNYLHALNTIDDIKQASLAMRYRQFTNPTGGTVRGMTLSDATQLKRNYEAANPELIDFGKAYRGNLKSLRSFEKTGEYATKSPKDIRWENTQRPNYVPMGGKRWTGDPANNPELGSPVRDMAKEMQARLRDRMQNEVKGMYVDELRKLDPRLAVRVTQDELKVNKWDANVVTFKRRGVAEHYTTAPLIADVLRMDPYFMASGPSQILYTSKRAFEIATTGELAPHFALTSAIRSWWIGKFTTPAGRSSPSIVGTATAIPRQLVPQLAEWIAPRLENASGGWLGQVFGRGNVQALSQRLALAHTNSLMHQLDTVGGGRGSIMQQQMQINNRLTQTISTAAGPLKTVLEGYRALLNSIHNAPAFDYARKNQGRTGLPQLAAEARHMTGDPRIGGEYYTSVRGEPRAIRFENRDNPFSRAVGKAVKGYGWAAEAARTAVPWFNTTVQGMKRFGEAYLADPVRFTTNLWLYAGLPAAASYTAARSMGNEYLDYMMNRRSEYNKMMNLYLPIPGRPPEEGFEIPYVHELSGFKHMMEVGLDHAFRSAIFTEYEDFRRALGGFIGDYKGGYLSVVADPPMPPAANVLLAGFGMVGSQGVFAGEAYQKKSDPFDQLGGLPTSIELYARAIAPAIADIAGTGAAAFTQTPGNIFQAMGNFVSQSGKRLIEKTPVVRDVLNMTPPMTGNNAITEELFKKQHAIKALDGFYSKWTDREGLIGVTRRRGELAPYAPSKGGAATATEQLGDRMPAQRPGIPQPEPTNPLYKMFAAKVHEQFAKDNPAAGGIGFKSLWQRYSMASEAVRDMRKINNGNYITWQKELDKPVTQIGQEAADKTQRQYLTEHKIDPTNLRQVRNFYERQRQDAARTILFTIRAVEDKFSKELGQQVKIEDLNPYGKGLGEAPVGFDASPVDF